MKKFACLLLVCLLIASTGYAQKEDRDKKDIPGNPEERFEREREFQEHRRDLGFKQRMQEFERKRNALLESRRNLMDQPVPPLPPTKVMNCPGMQNCPMMAGNNIQGSPVIGKFGGCPMAAKKCRDAAGLFMLVMLVVHILLAIWVYQDIRKRNSESGIWIIIALLTGLLGTAVYAIVRLGESNKSK